MKALTLVPTLIHQYVTMYIDIYVGKWYSHIAAVILLLLDTIDKASFWMPLDIAHLSVMCISIQLSVTGLHAS